MRSEHPTPVVTPTVEEQVARARDGVYVIQKCVIDGSVWFPPSSNCPTCLGTDLTWQEVSGRARLWSWIRIHQPYLKAFTDEIPYVVAYVKLEEGPFLMSTIVGTDPAELPLDQELTLSLESFGQDGLPLPVFHVAF